MTVPRSTTPRNAAPLRDPLLVDETEAARLCGVSKPTFRDWVDAGFVSRVRLPGNLRRNLYRLDDLRRFADELTGERS